ncbi:MAG TPA: 2OG-Fe(II) oxygenase family protein [Steroidobacteraceae bacterium]|jgi:isopenicillin N synthase-like dioxygenase|nr:2OG-Fe(II) oxygenase family protein [Steroidobacteraceae bacterium]
MDHSIPLIDIGSLFHAPSRQRDLTDQSIMTAAATPGFMVVRGFPPDIPAGRAARTELLRLFQLPETETRKLWRQKFDPAHPNVYRGWFPLQTGFLTAKEGIDIGADVVHGAAVVRSDDPLREPTPLPPATALPGWHESVAAYYLAMEKASQALMRSIARGLSLDEHFFDSAFDRGLSTLRLLRYPIRTDIERTARSDPSVCVTHDGVQSYINGAPHVDSGFLTLLAQDGIPGLQARHRDGTWLDVHPADDGLAVNFGKVLERWCGGRIKATEHRVIGSGRERMSIPFFYEARADAEIRPLPMDGAESFEPFFYGDYLWATTTQFVEFKGMESLRKPTRT